MANVIVRCFGDERFQIFFPTEHYCRVMQKIIVLHVNLCLYFQAAEHSLLNIFLILAENSLLNASAQEIANTSHDVVGWAHTSEQIPDFFLPEEKITVNSRLPFWCMSNKKIKDEGSLPHIKLFKHGLQTLYSKTKVGVDQSAQAQAILRSFISHLNGNKSS